MSQYIMMVNKYLPKPGATTMCVIRIIEELVKRGNHINVIAHDDGYNCENQNGICVKKIQTPGYYSIKNGSSSSRKKIFNLIGQIHKILTVKDYPLKSKYVVKHYIKEACDIIDENTDSKITLMASLNPIESVIAAAEIKKIYGNRVETIYYCADTLSNIQGNDSVLPTEYRKKCGIRWETELFKSFDKIIIMECHREHYLSETFKEFHNKMKFANFPLLSELPAVQHCTEDNEELLFVYAGSLYRNLRNPKYLCDVLSDLKDFVDFSAIFMGNNECNDIFNQLSADGNTTIRHIGMQSHDTVSDYLLRADVLLSIGNKESLMAPSKIYEYMATGKPIIHVYSWEKDPCIEPLLKYGNALIIKEHDITGSDKIKEFIENIHNLSFDEVKEKFITSTPEFSADIIEQLN